MAVTRLPVKGSVLVWARESMNLDQETAAKRANCTLKNLSLWENGELSPTMNQLRSLAKVYSRPVGALMLPEPPVEDTPHESIPDFRNLENQANVIPAALQQAIVRARQQREDLLEISDLLHEDESNSRLKFSFSDRDTAEHISLQIRELLDFHSFPPQTFNHPENFLRALVKKVEDLGILVIQVQRVPVEVMRGFSLAEDRYPIVGLNGGDWPRGKIFTLLHELTHIGIRNSGLCDLSQDVDSRIERLCDSVAASVLMPRESFLQASARYNPPYTGEEMVELGKIFGASGESAMLRLVELGKASWDKYFELRPRFYEAYREYKIKEKAKQTSDAPIYYALKTRDLGRPFIRKVVQAYGEDVISSRDLATMLQVKFEKVPKLVQSAGAE